MKIYLIRGIFMILLGLLTISLVAMYLYYYYNNELLNSDNKIKYRVFGPSSILIMLIIVNFITLLYCIFLSITFAKSALEDDSLMRQVKNKCPKYKQLSNVIIGKIKSKIKKPKKAD